MLSYIKLIPLFSTLAVAGLFIGSPAFAKRTAPPDVKSIEQEGYRYDPGSSIRCVDLKTGQTVWITKIFDVEVNPSTETDVQDIFLQTMDIQGQQLVAKDERGTVYHLDLKTGNRISPKEIKIYPKWQ